MLFTHLRKLLLIAGFALLVTPSVALANDDQMARYQIVFIDPPATYEDCVFLEWNIPGFDCHDPVARIQELDPRLLPPPPGVDYLFWEQNVWELESGDVVAEAAVPEYTGGLPMDFYG